MPISRQMHRKPWESIQFYTSPKSVFTILDRKIAYYNNSIFGPWVLQQMLWPRYLFGALSLTTLGLALVCIFGLRFHLSFFYLIYK